MIWHSSNVDEVLSELKSDKITGLTDEFAEERLRKINLKIKKKNSDKTFLDRLGKELKNTVYYFLYAVIALTILIHFIIPNSISLTLPITVLALALLKAIASAAYIKYTEVRLGGITFGKKTKIKALRSGKTVNLPIDKIVPGDIIFIEEGALVPADARLISAEGLHIDEMAVTGETVPAVKDALANIEDIAPLNRRANMVYAGTHVLTGNGVAVVTEILDYTEQSKKGIIDSDNSEDKLGIETKLKQLSKLISVGLAVLFAVIFIITLVCAFVAKFSIIPAILYSAVTVAALASAFTPETIELLLCSSDYSGVSRMAKEDTVISDVGTINKISRADVICADKTGIFTENKMVLSEIFAGGRMVNMASDVIEGDHKMLLRLAALCCDGEVKMVRGVSVQHGDATQTAIIAASIEHLGLSKYDLDNTYPRMAAIPFSADRKLMTTVNVIDGAQYVIVRGSVDKLIPKCSGDCSGYLKIAENMSSDGMRVIGLAIRTIDNFSAEISEDELENGLMFIGLLGLCDVPRLDSKDAVIECRDAGIGVVMITGDNKNAAFATARKLRITSDIGKVMTGEQIKSLSDDELMTVVETYSVFSEVDTDSRARIVSALKKCGKYVAVTGDSNENTDSLRIADVAYSMGKNGTASAISESEVIIKNDTFASIVRSFATAKSVYHNLMKSVRFFFSAIFGIMLSVLVGSAVFGINADGPSIISDASILLLSIFSVIITSVAITFEPTEPTDLCMTLSDFDLFNSAFSLDIVYLSVIYAISGILPYILCSLTSLSKTTSPMTFTYLTASLTVLLSGLLLKSDTFSLSSFKENKVILITTAISLVVTLISTLSGFCGLCALPFVSWLIAIAISLALTATIAIIRIFRR